MQQDIEKLTQAELFKKVGDICAVVNTVNDSQQLLDISLKEAMDLFGAMRGSVFIWDDHTKDLVLKSAIGLKWAEKLFILLKAIVYCIIF